MIQDSKVTGKIEEELKMVNLIKCALWMQITTKAIRYWKLTRKASGKQTLRPIWEDQGAENWPKLSWSMARTFRIAKNFYRKKDTVKDTLSKLAGKVRTHLDPGITQAQIARDLAIQIVRVCKVIHGRQKSRRVTEYIEQLCNRPRDS